MGIAEWFQRRALEKTDRVMAQMTPEEKEKWDHLAYHGTAGEKKKFIGEMLKKYEGRKR
ncbi:MAG: hypothetical protein ACREX3_20770 [Gammaproteobacteria bacterium]